MHDNVARAVMVFWLPLHNGGPPGTLSGNSAINEGYGQAPGEPTVTITGNTVIRNARATATARFSRADTPAGPSH